MLHPGNKAKHYYAVVTALCTALCTVTFSSQELNTTFCPSPLVLHSRPSSCTLRPSLVTSGYVLGLYVAMDTSASDQMPSTMVTSASAMTFSAYRSLLVALFDRVLWLLLLGFGTCFASVAFEQHSGQLTYGPVLPSYPDHSQYYFTELQSRRFPLN